MRLQEEDRPRPNRRRLVTEVGQAVEHGARRVERAVLAGPECGEAAVVVRARKRLGRRRLAVQECAQPRPVEGIAVGLDEGCRTDEVHPAAIVAFREQRLRLHHVPGRQVLRPRPPGAGEHLALVPARREDRRARPERRRKVDAPPDHGRQGGAVLRHGGARARRDRRPARAGAVARPGQGRARQRRGRRARAPRPARPLQRDLRAVRRAGCRLRHAARRAGEGAGRDRPRRRLAARRPSRPRHGRAAAAGRRPRRGHPLRRRTPPRRALPAAALVAGAAAARRADEPSRRRVGCVARAVPRRVQGHRRRRDARPLLPRQRRRLDPRARPRPRHPVPRQLLVVARAEAGAARRRGEDGVRAPPHARTRARVGAHEPARTARQVEGAPRRVREAVRGGAEREARQGRDPHSAGAAPRRPRHRRRRRPEGLRRPAARRGPDVLAAARRHRRRDRPERRRQDDAVPDDRRRGEDRTAAR